MQAAIDTALARFAERHPESKKLHENAQRSLPGGNTRTLLHTAPFPISMRKGEDYKLFDEDGNEYCDLTSEMTAGLYGHSHPRLQQALISAIHDIGLSLGATNVHEQRFASLLCSRFGLDRVRFTNSGTEANLHCLAAARKFTGRRKVVVFRGGYHGSVLSFANGIAANNVDPGDWIVVQYNDVAGLERAFDAGEEIAAVLVEGIQGAAGSIPGSPEFLRAIRELAKKHGALFILDEVMTSRLAPGGLKSLLDVKPDMVTLGKYLGGGMPFGAFGGLESVMSVYDPRVSGSLAHSGTFQNNTMMLHAGFVGLSEVYTPDAVHELNARGNDLRERLQGCFQGTKLCVTGRGSLMCIHATKGGLRPGQVTCMDNIQVVEDGDLKTLFWLEMLDGGFWMPARGSVALNLQTPVEALDGFVHAVNTFCEKHKDLVAV